MKALGIAAVLGLCGVPLAHAQDIGEGFTDTKDGGMQHVSGFVCPAHIDLFERDAVGETDSESNASFCSYSALDGTYGTVTLSQLKGPYDPKAALASAFLEQEGIGAHRVAETTVKAPGSPLAIYTRTYETSKLETLHYKILFSGAAVGNWAVETTIEYADPRDNAAQKAFLDAVYDAAIKQIGLPPIPVTPAQQEPKPAAADEEPNPAPQTQPEKH